MAGGERGERVSKRGYNQRDVRGRGRINRMHTNLNLNPADAVGC